MKRESFVIKENVDYEIEFVFNNIAEIRMKDGKIGLLNTTTNHFIGEPNDYNPYSSYSSYDFYFQITDDKSRKIRIYDILNDKIIVDNWEIVETFGEKSKMYVLRSPIDRKLHIFDVYSFRTNQNIFDVPLDGVKKLNYVNYPNLFLELTKNYLKGAYFRDEKASKTSRIVAPIEYNKIASSSSAAVFTKGKMKRLAFFKKGKMEDIIFDDITFDNNAVYCKNDNTIYVYDMESEKFMFKTNADEVEYFSSDWHNYFYKLRVKDKFGIVRVIIKDDTLTNDVDPQVDIIVLPIYDKVEKPNIYMSSIITQNDKKGLLFSCDSKKFQTIEPKCDDIKYLGHSYFAFYNDSSELFDIYDILSNNFLEPIVTDCESIYEYDFVYLYEKNGKYGIITKSNNKIIPPIFDNITKLDDHCFIVEENNRKGLFDVNRLAIPVEYDNITRLDRFYYLLEKDGKMGVFHLDESREFGRFYSNSGEKHNDEFVFPLECDSITYKYLSFSLKKDGKCTLASLNEDVNVKILSNHKYDSIEFYSRIIVCKDKTGTYVYDVYCDLIKVLPVCYSIEEHIEKKNEDYEFLYYFDDVCYRYYDNIGVLERTCLDNPLVYLSRYETLDDIFEVRSYDKNAFDLFCEVVDSMRDDMVEDYLRKMVDDSTQKIHSLSLKRISKNK